MSSGDKNTFALSFFLSQLKRDPHIANKIVVFVDPFTSLDDFRRAMTAQEIVLAGETDIAAQFILLIHYLFFLYAFLFLFHSPTFSPLQLSPFSSSSSFLPFFFFLFLFVSFLLFPF